MRILSAMMAVAGIVVLGSCVSPPVESPQPCVSQQTHFTVAQGLHDKVDVLFMVDNSPSMAAMQEELQKRFGELFTVFQDLAADGTFADLHIGVVTSDYGAGRSGPPDGACDPSPGGQRGLLQALGADADPSCRAPVGARYLEYDFADGGKVNNLPPGQGLVDTFRCMASVGSSGCGFEHQLESVYAALHNHVENEGFLRDDAILAVVFLTNEDDASAPTTTDLFLRSKDGQDYVWHGTDEGPYGYEGSYPRQTRFAVMCGAPARFPPYGDSGGPLDGCVPAPNPGGEGPGLTWDVSRYVDFLTRPTSQGGLKDNPDDDVILVGIDAPATPFQVLLSNPSTPAGTPYKGCTPLDEKTGCLPVLQHSCVGADANFFGDPSVRLNTVIAAAKTHGISSICDADYSAAMQGLGKLIVGKIGTGCLVSPLADPQHPDCVVEDTLDGKVTGEIPSCDKAAPPCWKVEAKQACKAAPGGLGVTIVRAVPAPAGTTAQIRCATLAAPTDGTGCGS